MKKDEKKEEKNRQKLLSKIAQFVTLLQPNCASKNNIYSCPVQ